MSYTQHAGRITADCLVNDIAERHPQTITVFIRHGLQCVGCYISPHHTIADSAREYALDVGPLLDDLNQAILAGATGHKPPGE